MKIVCPSTPGVLTDLAVENSYCEYDIYISSPWVCNIPWMKKQPRRKLYVLCYDLSEDEASDHSSVN